MDYTNMAAYYQNRPAEPTYSPHPLREGSQPIFTPPGVSRPHISSPAIQSQYPRLMYFITRSNGTIAPVIPADELPYSVRLEGVPRNMSPDETLGMQFLGALPYTGTFFKTKDEGGSSPQRSADRSGTPAHQRHHSNGKQYMSPDALARQATANAAYSTLNLGNPYATSANPFTRAQDTTPPIESSSSPTPPPQDPQAVIDAILSSSSGAAIAARAGYTSTSPYSSTTSVPPSGKIPDANKKTHCSYWIRTGECAYTQQGCMYMHEMPDAEGLKALGFRGTPRWWLEKNAAVKLGGAVAGGAGEKKEKETVGPKMGVSEWLRKGSMVETESESEDSGSEGEVKKSKDGEQDREENEKNGPIQEKKFTILKKPVEYSKKPSETSSKEAKFTASTATASSSGSGDLIDFDSPDSASSATKATTLTPSTSADSSPRPSTATPKAENPRATNTSRSGSPSKSKAIFVPKGESKEQHLAARASRQRSSSDTPSRRTNMSASHVKKIDREIQRAAKSKAPAPSRGALLSGEESTVKDGKGLMASKHAPSPGSATSAGAEKAHRAEGKKVGGGSGRGPHGLRVRRPLRVAEIPTNGRMAKTSEGGKGSEKKDVE